LGGSKDDKWLVGPHLAIHRKSRGRPSRDENAVAPMIKITKDFDFQSAHFLPNVRDGHKCAKLHGHSYKVEISVTGDVNEPEGWVVDFADIERAVAPLLQLIDHHCLNEVEGLENPTAENIAIWFGDRLNRLFPGLSAIVVHEESTCRAEWSASTR
jgi:6-pyruvoyltetrahydropterin/6-carboxytetrahydropterin synthase